MNRLRALWAGTLVVGLGSGLQQPEHVLEPKSGRAPFGGFFSWDGVHPNLATHRLIAAHIIEPSNATYGSSILQTR